MRRKPSAIGLLGALLLSACLSDGPNQVGGDYLDRHGILLETPVYKVTLADFPVDSFWTEDLSPSRLGDTAMLLGVEDGFSSQMRLAFNIPDTALLDSLDADSSLRLSLGFYRFPNQPSARAHLDSMLAGATQLKVLVESWVVKDTGLGDEARAESLLVRTRRFLIRQDTSTLIPGPPVLDTLVLKLDQAYESGVPDSLQAFALAALRDTLRSDPTAKWLVQLQLTPMPDTADSGSQAMVRLGGSVGDVFSPHLIFGTKARGILDAAKGTQKLLPITMPESRNRLGINYKLRFTGAPGTILVGKNQGLHLRIDRAEFLDSLDKALEAQNVDLNRTANGEFDLSYFVPFAHIRLPIESSWVEGDYRLQFVLFSDLDSLLPAPDRVAASQAVVPLGTDTALAVLTSSSQTVDTIRFAYGIPTPDPELRRVIISSYLRPKVVDTVYFHVGETRTIVTSATSGQANRLIFDVTADSSAARVAIHINTKTDLENNTLRDPVTGDPITELNRSIPRFFKPGTDDSLGLRATRSFQRIVNRASLGEEIQSDLFLQPAQNPNTFAAQTPAFDSAASARAAFPVVGELRPAAVSGRLGIGVTIYLYPLKVR